MTEPSSEERSTVHAGYFVPDYAYGPGSDITISSVVSALRLHLVLIGIVVIACSAAAAAIAFLMTPIYRSEVVMAPVQSSQTAGSMLSIAGQLSGLAGLAGLTNEGDETQIALATLRGREFTSQFIRENDLLPVLFGGLYDRETRQWSVPGDEQPTLWDGYKVFDQRVRKVSQDNASGIVTVAVEWSDPEIAADWANRLVAALNRRMRTKAEIEAESNLEFLRKQLGQTNLVEVQQGLSRLIEAQINKVMLASSRDEYAFSVIDPAVAADADDFIRPKRPAIVVAGLVAGLLLGILLALVLAMRPARANSDD